MEIISWNVAGLRACEKKGFLDFLEKYSPDVLCLQETKALPEQLNDHLVTRDDYDILYAPAVKKGYSGVSTWVKKSLNHKNTIGIGIEKFDNEGRAIITEFDSFFLFNCYFPNGQRDHARVPYKMEFCEEVEKLAYKLKSKHNKEIIITGDYNTAHHPIDLANPKTNTKTTGFLPIEREWMTEFEKAGFVDMFRKYNPDQNGHYTWWTYRNDCRGRNIGWRIDYFFATQGIADKSQSCTHFTEVLGSDHCPISLKLLE